MSHSSLRILSLLHCLGPFTYLAFATTLSTLSACLVPPSRRAVLGRSQRTISKWLALTIATLYAVEGSLYLFGALMQPQWPLDSDAFAYVTLFTLIWLASFLFLEDAATVFWLPNFGSCVLSCSLEGVVCYLSVQGRPRQDIFEQSRFVVKLYRITCFLFLGGIISVPIYLVSEMETGKGPLLVLDLKTQSTLEDSEKDESNVRNMQDIDEGGTQISDKKNELQEEQNRQLERLGGWWAYLQEFRIFLPHIIPIKDRKLQGYTIGVAFLILCDRASNLLGPRLLGDIIDSVSHLKSTGQMPWGKIFFFIFVIKIPHDQCLVPLREYLSTRLRYWSYGRLLSVSFQHVMGLSLEYHENKTTGEVEAAVNQADTLCELIDHLARDATPLLLDLVVAFGYLSIVFDVYFGLILAYAYFLYVVITYKMTGWAVRLRKKYIETNVRQRHIFNQSISNWQTAAYFNRQTYQQRCLDDATQEEIAGMLKYLVVGQIIHISQGLNMCLGYGAVLLLASYQVVKKDQPVGDIVMLLLYWNTFSRPLFALTVTYKNLINYVTDAEELLKIWQLRPTVIDAPGAKDLIFRGGGVEFRDVRFSYGRQKEILNGITFNVCPGSTVAFVGKTGTGKTTICTKLLARFYDVTGGSIFIDGQDVRDVTQHSLRETIGVVRQDPAFYTDTILNVLRYARLDATDEQIFEACKNAAIHDQILEFPQGYNSKVGERGVKLSGGEKQRLAIAQLFLKDPKIIVLDEATSSVDTITEAEIQDSFARLCHGRTTFIIAHRLSTVKDADQIFVLDEKQIVERGRHNELLAMRGKYHKLWMKKEKANELEAMIRWIATLDENQDSLVTDLIELSDDGSSSSAEETWQVDGQGDSKQINRSRHKKIGARKRVHGFEQHFKKKRENEDAAFRENHEANDNATIKTISPRPTNTSIQEPPHRRLFSITHHSHKHRRRSIDEQPTNDKKQEKETVVFSTISGPDAVAVAAPSTGDGSEQKASINESPPRL